MFNPAEAIKPNEGKGPVVCGHEKTQPGVGSLENEKQDSISCCFASFFFLTLSKEKKKKLKLYKIHELIADKLMEFAQEPELEINSI